MATAVGLGTRLKLGVRSLIQVSHGGSDALALGGIFCYFSQMHQQEAGSDVEHLGLKPVPTCDADMHQSWLGPLPHHTGPLTLFLNGVLLIPALLVR